MDKLSELNRIKGFLRKVIKSRKAIARYGKSPISSQFVKTEIANIDAALPQLVSLDSARKYIERKETALRMLIPSNKGVWFDELRDLIQNQLN